MLGLGCDGVISVSGQGVPEAFCKVYDSRSRQLVCIKRCTPIVVNRLICYLQRATAGIKAVLEIRRICSDHVRLPLVPATSRLKASIKAELTV